MNDVLIDLASAIARGELAHGLGAAFLLLELGRIGGPLRWAEHDDDELWPVLEPPVACAPDSMMSFEQTLMRCFYERGHLDGLEALDEELLARMALRQMARWPWGTVVVEAETGG